MYDGSIPSQETWLVNECLSLLPKDMRMAKANKAKTAAQRLDNIQHARAGWQAKQDRKRFIRESNARTRAGLTAMQQIDRLDARLGKGQGAVKERARLALQWVNS